MKIYMNKKNSENVTLIAIADDRYIIETAAGAQKSYSASSFKKMFKFIEEIDENQTTLDTPAEETTEEVTEEVTTSEEATEETTEKPALATSEEVEEAPKSVKKAAKKKAILVKMVAFTGMNIGEFNAVVTKQGYEVATKRTGVLYFDKKGIQTNAKNPKFGNKLILK